MKTIRYSHSRERIGITAILYAMYCALLPFNMILNFTGFTVNKYLGILVSIIAAVEVIWRRKNVISTKYIFFVLFLLWSLLSLLWSINLNRTISAMVTLMSLVLLSMLMLIRGINRNEMVLIKYCMIIPSAAVLFYLAPNLNVSYTRATLQTSAGTADHNSLAANLVFPLLICIDEIKYQREKIKKIISIVSLLFIILSLLLITSRGALVAAIVGGIAYYASENKGKKSITLIGLIKSLLALIIVLIVAYLIIRYVDLPAIKRLQVSAIISDRGTNRFSVWQGFWEAINHSPVRFLVGYGYGTEGDISSIFLYRYVGAHNVYLEHWATIGFIGLLFLLFMFYEPIRVAREKKDSLAISIMIALFVVCMPLGFLANKGAWNAMVLAFVGMRTNYRDVNVRKQLSDGLNKGHV